MLQLPYADHALPLRQDRVVLLLAKLLLPFKALITLQYSRIALSVVTHAATDISEPANRHGIMKVRGVWQTSILPLHAPRAS